ncbi:SNF2 family N-terminal domain-containing protein [Desarmillaria tabescens]|uniref:SNF2 family N-terminal domain-containing protein n=1 Tax=Armillaria tabescens TaxID=1929756 RepID=A0AA39MTJ5_ARMTA|nr:SNF2 family N-terminal domain-containing protein [Desarmillaria tabescens]KAK0446072.1 SNF2 family N-terminal domain-containing protein [Desarmillaria tabescens]
MPPSPEQVALAKKQLGISPSAPNTTVPAAYIDELTNHLKLYPHDINFRIVTEPNRGYGRLTCLENGCKGPSMPLERNVKLADGGRSIGVGSLSMYRFHIAQHPTHTKSRYARVSSLSSAPHMPSPAVKREHNSLLNLLDEVSPFGAPNVTSASTPSDKPLLAARRRSSLAKSSPARAAFKVKPEPVEAVVPLKRLYEPSLLDTPRKALVPSGAAPSLKKVKREDSLIKPLGVVNRDRDGDIAMGSPRTTSVEDLRRELTEIQMKISDLERLHENLNRKKRKTKADLTKMFRFMSELDDLRKKRDECNASIPNMSPLKRTLSKPLFPKPEPISLKVPKPENNLPSTFSNPFYNDRPNPLASGSNVKLPGLPGLAGFPIKDDSDDDAMDVDPAAGAAAILNRVVGIAIPDIAPVAGADNRDANGDYFGRGRDTFQGPVAKADDIEKFLIEAGNAEQFDGNASVNEGLQKLGLDSITSLLPGMEVPLMPHQVIGVAWMAEKEKSTLKGGLLGDDMGLGKTVQMIALMIKDRSNDPLCKTNLIMAPLALLDQWKLEIELKSNDSLKCIVYHGSGKPKRKQDLLKYDVVLTTYQTMALEWPDFEKDQKAKEKARRKSGNDFIVSDSDDDSSGPTRKKKKQQKGLLFQVDFYRIILDEAQAVRNRRTRASRATTELQCIYRWCLTGTPIINSLSDVYGYLRFLRIRPWYDWAEFHGHVNLLEKKNPALAVTRLQTILNMFVLRRMKNTMLDGKRLIDLPEKETALTKLEFTVEEREIYKMVEARSQATFNRYLRAGTVLKNYSQVLVLLLRLRQLCSHPSLIQEDGVAFIQPEEDEDNWRPEVKEELLRARKLLGGEFVSRLKRQFMEATLKRMEAEKAETEAEVEECAICFDAFTSAVVTACGHSFCRECLDDVLSGPQVDAEDEPKLKAQERRCPNCRQPISGDLLFDRAAFEPSDAELNGGKSADGDEPAQSTTSAKGKGKAKARAKGKGKRKSALNADIIDIDALDNEDEEEDEDDMSDFIVDSDEDEEEKDARQKLKKAMGKRKAFIVLDSDEEGDEVEEVVFGRKKENSMSGQIKLMPKFLASTKMQHMMKQIVGLFEEKPNEKVLVISQWTGCLDLVSAYLTEKSIEHVKYQGCMSRHQRDLSVRAFMSTRESAKVMLMSLKCGGVGLNLTRANNVISLDLGWSQAVEAQAFDRVHRLGQTRPVKVDRLVISDTVEDRILALQERKQNLADGSLGEGNGKKIGKLSVKELANLFGLDARGRLL